MIEQIEDGEVGLSVRTKLNEVIDATNAGTTEYFNLVENSVGVPINVPEDNVNWITAIDIQYTGIPNGLYIVDAVLVISPNTASKSYRVRQVDKGIAYAGISEESSDATNRVQVLYRTFLNIDDGIVDTQIEVQLEEGQGSEDLVVEYTFYDIELKKITAA